MQCVQGLSIALTLTLSTGCNVEVFTLSRTHSIHKLAAIACLVTTFGAEAPFTVGPTSWSHLVGVAGSKRCRDVMGATCCGSLRESGCLWGGTANVCPLLCICLPGCQHNLKSYSDMLQYAA